TSHFPFGGRKRAGRIGATNGRDHARVEFGRGGRYLNRRVGELPGLAEPEEDGAIESVPHRIERVECSDHLRPGPKWQPDGRGRLVVLPNGLGNEQIIRGHRLSRGEAREAPPWREPDRQGRHPLKGSGIEVTTDRIAGGALRWQRANRGDASDGGGGGEQRETVHEFLISYTCPLV